MFQSVNSFKSFLVLLTVFPSCISKSYDPRWNNAELPENEVIKIKGLLKEINFLLRDRSKSEWLILKRDDPIPESVWIPDGDVKLIVHGYVLRGKLSTTSNSTHKILQTVKEKLDEQNILELGLEYSRNSSVNVFVVDWTAISTDTLGRYFEVSEYTRYVGEELARFLVRLAKDSYVKDWDKVHAIGFSLGGQTVGVVGAKVQELAGVKIGRITGLDPAGPNFDNDGRPITNFYRILDKGDGKFVDVIHSNMILPDKSNLGRYGTFVQSGHADFYPDGGVAQSLCTKKKDRSTIPCSHIICVKFMTQSIKNPVLACPCESWNTFKEGKCTCTSETKGVYMGDQCDIHRASGKYYLQMKQ